MNDNFEGGVVPSVATQTQNITGDTPAVPDFSNWVVVEDKPQEALAENSTSTAAEDSFKENSSDSNSTSNNVAKAEFPEWTEDDSLNADEEGEKNVPPKSLKEMVVSAPDADAAVEMGIGHFSDLLQKNGLKPDEVQQAMHSGESFLGGVQNQINTTSSNISSETVSKPPKSRNDEIIEKMTQVFIERHHMTRERALQELKQDVADMVQGVGDRVASILEDTDLAETIRFLVLGEHYGGSADHSGYKHTKELEELGGNQVGPIEIEKHTGKDPHVELELLCEALKEAGLCAESEAKVYLEEGPEKTFDNLSFKMKLAAISKGLKHAEFSEAIIKIVSPGKEAKLSVEGMQYLLMLPDMARANFQYNDEEHTTDDASVVRENKQEANV